MSDVLMQYNLKQGLKRFGDAARAVFQKEMMQIHNRKVLKPWQKKDFSPEELAMILTYIMTIKEKNNGTVKERGYANGVHML